MTAKELGKILKEAREGAGLTLDNAYAGCKIHVDLLRDMEKGVFDRLNKIYIKSFLKKYAAYLHLDANDILKKYEEISGDIQDKEYIVEEEEAERKKVARLALPLDEKHIQMALVGVLSVVFFILLFVLVGRIKAKVTGPKEAAPAAAVRRREPVRRVEKKAEPAPRTRTVRKILPLPVDANKPAPVILTLKAEGEVWVKVADQAKTVFVATMHAGETKTIKAEGVLTVWTGKGENLIFVVNTRNLGRLVNGVVKDIKVTAQGVLVGDQWVYRL